MAVGATGGRRGARRLVRRSPIIADASSVPGRGAGRSDIIAAFPRDVRTAPLPLEALSPDPPLRPSLSGRVRVAIVGMLLVASTDVMLLRSSSRCSTTSAPSTPTRCGGCRYSIVGVFVLRGIGSYASEYGLAWIGSRVVYDLRCEACDHLLRLPTPFYDATLGGIPAVPDHVRRAADRGDGVRGDHRQHPQHADDRVHARLPAVSQLAAHADRVRHDSAARLLAAQDQAPHEAREHDGPGAHRRADARAGRGDRRAPDRQDLRRREVRERPAPRGRGQAAAVDGEAGGGVGARHADQPDHRLDRGRRDPVGRGPAERRRALRRRRFRHLPRRAAAPHEPAEDAVQRAGGHRSAGSRRRRASSR